MLQKNRIVIKMKYIDTKPITAHLLVEQLEMLQELQREIEIEFDMKISLTELIRKALNEGLPRIKRNKALIGIWEDNNVFTN
jgi:hypothetical protein